jgi:hypothetical protein
MQQSGWIADMACSSTCVLHQYLVLCPGQYGTCTCRRTTKPSSVGGSKLPPLASNLVTSPEFGQMGESWVPNDRFLDWSYAGQ